MTLLSNRTRLKVFCIVFFTCIITAWAKHFFSGISIELVSLGVVQGLAYLYAETKRPSENGKN